MLGTRLISQTPSLWMLVSAGMPSAAQSIATVSPTGRSSHTPVSSRSSRSLSRSSLSPSISLHRASPSSDTAALITGVALEGAAGEIANFGTILGSVFLQDGGDLTNGSAADTTALITGVANYGRPVVIANYGTIQGGSSGVYLRAGGTIINGSASDSIALISGAKGARAVGTGVVAERPATIINYGTVEGNGFADGVNLYDGGIVTNGSTGDTTALIFGGYNGVTASASRITNFGTMKGAANAGAVFVYSSAGGGILTNGSASDTSASIAGDAIGVWDLRARTTIANLGTIRGGNSGLNLRDGGTVRNGSAGDAVALITGKVGVAVYGSAAATTVTNFGAIIGTGGTALLFDTASDRLIAETGSSCTGAVKGGGGTLELARGRGTVTNLGAAGSVSGSMTMSFSGFGAYVFDSGGSWTLAAAATLGADQSLTNYSTIDGALTLAATSARMIMEAGSTITGRIIGGGGTLDLASGSGTITGLGVSGTLSGAEAMTFSGFGAYVIGADESWTLVGAAALAADQTLTNSGEIIGNLSMGSPSDRLIAEMGSAIVGEVTGGGGLLELASGSGTIIGLGATGVISGDVSMTFSAFGSYFLDSGSSWTLAGDNTVAGDLPLTSQGALILTGALSGPGGLLIQAGSATIDSGASLSVAAWAMSGGAVILGESLKYTGSFYEGGGTLTLGAGDTLNLIKTSNFSGIIDGGGEIEVHGATVNELTIGGTTRFRAWGTIDQNGLVYVGDQSSAAATLVIARGSTYDLEDYSNIVQGYSSASIIRCYGDLVNSTPGVNAVGVRVDDGGAIIAASGVLDLTAVVSGPGELSVASGATLELDSTVTRTLSMTFDGADAVLALGDPAKFAATIDGFAATDAIDLIEITATGASINTQDQLVIVDGAATVATLQLSGVYGGATVTVGSDGHGGTDLTLATPAGHSPPAAATAPPVHTLIAAMAGLGATVASIPTSAPHVEAWRATLLAPRTQLA